MCGLACSWSVAAKLGDVLSNLLALLMLVLQAVLAQVCMLAEVTTLVDAANVPAELRCCGTPLRLIDADVRSLLLEFPGCGLVRLDDVTARARAI